jgi:hypothetical protein
VGAWRANETAAMVASAASTRTPNAMRKVFMIPCPLFLL